jgi:AraC-like DNA-binding protein
MTQDTLSDVLRSVRLKGAVFFYVDATPPWVVETPHAREIIPSIMPCAEHMIGFHAVAEGTCYGAMSGDRPIRLDAHDIILFPQGDPHVMSSAPGMKPPLAEKEFYSSLRPPQMPTALRLGGDVAASSRVERGGPERATVVCGFLGLDSKPFNPLIAAMPRVLHVAGASLGPDSWVATFFRAAAEESNHRRPGGEAVLERMSEMMFVEVLRRYVDALPAGQTGWLAGMRDPSIGRVLALLHEKPGMPWTLERLADEVAMSRSTLHDRFVHFMGQPPMQYLTQWRMQVAAGLLRDSNAKLTQVALGVGYESEAAFSRAFKRAVGVAPGAWRGGRRADREPEQVVP